MTKRTGDLLELDSRNRISLGALATHDRYLVNVEPDGVITLTPVVVIPASKSYALSFPGREKTD